MTVLLGVLGVAAYLLVGAVVVGLAERWDPMEANTEEERGCFMGAFTVIWPIFVAFFVVVGFISLLGWLAQRISGQR